MRSRQAQENFIFRQYTFHMLIRSIINSGLSFFKITVVLGFTIFVFPYNYVCAATIADWQNTFSLAATNSHDSNATTGLHYLNPVLHKGVLLIAAENLVDPNFSRTVILVTEINEEGTSGLVLNRRTSIPIARALPQILKIFPAPDYLYTGGPVTANAVNLLVNTDTPLSKANNIIDHIYLINTLELFNKIIVKNINIKSIRLYSGIAAWAPGQLESELIRGHWYLWHASEDIIFNKTPDSIWEGLIKIVTARWVLN